MRAAEHEEVSEALRIKAALHEIKSVMTLTLRRLQTKTQRQKWKLKMR